MKAIIYTKYGSPDVLRMAEVEIPVPEKNEVLVRVHAASINPYDWHFLRGKPYFMRLAASGFFRPKEQILGHDLAGRVEAVGTEVTQFKPGDEVFGGDGFGGFAEYTCVAEDKLVLMPKNSSFEDAASLPIAAITALQSLRDFGKVKAQQQVLINGASGGVGTFTVQLAKAFGAKVTAVCSTRNIELVRSLGADMVIDYTQADFTTNGQNYDLIIDNVGNRSVSDLKRALKPHGKCVIVGFTNMRLMITHALQGKVKPESDKKQVGLMQTARINQEDLKVLNALIEEKKIKPIIDHKYILMETPEAIEYVETGHARGKVVINVID